MTKRTRRRLRAAAVSLPIALTGAFALPAIAAPTTRLAASNNVDASLEWSRVSFANGTADTALLARDDVFADSLSSGAAQAKLSAPLLLNNNRTLDPRVLAELRRLGTEHVVIFGGQAAISPNVEQELTALGFTTERVSGPTRVETAVDMAQTVFPVTTSAIVARAFAGDQDPTQAFADSLATGAYAAATKMPVLYTNTEELPGATRSYLESSAVETVYIAGGEGAVSEGVAQALRELEIEVVRVNGANRFATAIAMAADAGFTSAGASSRVVLVDGTRPDAWASGFPAAIQSAGAGAPLVLANGDELPAETREYLSDANGRIPLICGPYTSESACDAAAAEMDNS